MNLITATRPRPMPLWFSKRCWRQVYARTMACVSSSRPSSRLKLKRKGRTMTTHPDLLQMAADDAVARSIPGQTFLAAAGDAWTDAFRRLFLATHGQPGHVPPHAMSDDEGCEVKGGYGAMSIRKGQAADIT